eukprot:3301981-Ditylum_brightwellii.AAC.1
MFARKDGTMRQCSSENKNYANFSNHSPKVQNVSLVEDIMRANNISFLNMMSLNMIFIIGENIQNAKMPTLMKSMHQ